MTGAGEQRLQILDGGQLTEVVEAEEAGSHGREKGGVGHGADGAQMVQQPNIRGAGAERVVADHRGYGLSAKLAVTAGIQVLIDGGLGGLGGLIEVLE